MTGIQDLARHLGLTVGTVSRALNNRPEVNEKTRQRVLDVALEIGYVPNQSGRSLRKGTTNNVGFMIESGTASAIAGGHQTASVKRIPIPDSRSALMSSGSSAIDCRCAFARATSPVVDWNQITPPTWLSRT